VLLQPFNMRRIVLAEKCRPLRFVRESSNEKHKSVLYAPPERSRANRYAIII